MRIHHPKRSMHWCNFGCGKKVVFWRAHYEYDPKQPREVYVCMKCRRIIPEKDLEEAGNKIR